MEGQTWANRDGPRRWPISATKDCRSTFKRREERGALVQGVVLPIDTCGGRGALQQLQHTGAVRCSHRAWTGAGWQRGGWPRRVHRQRLRASGHVADERAQEQLLGRDESAFTIQAIRW